MACLRNLSPKTKALLQGQWISVLIAGTGIFATILSDTHPSTNFPLLMSSCNYVLLSTYLLRRHLRGSPADAPEAVETTETEAETDTELDTEVARSPPAPRNLWFYVLAAVLDVQANFLVLLAYNYTTITSVMLLDCFTIPCAMVLSYVFLGCRYKFRHFAGTCTCLTGLACIVVNDSLNGPDEPGGNPILGDILCLSAAVLYACSNVLQEHLVKFHDREEFLGYLGCFGFPIAAVQCMFVDLPKMRTAKFTSEVVGAIVGFVTCLFLMYTNTTSFLQKGDAILFNLGLLTSDVYAVIFTFFFKGYLVSWLYFLAFALVIVGLVIYHSEEAPIIVGRTQGEPGLFSNLPPIYDRLGSTNPISKQEGVYDSDYRYRQQERSQNGAESVHSDRGDRGAHTYNPIVGAGGPQTGVQGAPTSRGLSTAGRI
eukprot:CAMPEP_0173278852 /NCGR_PEP_ID=MMETSP1143-20121109/4840_1 /TAXON_ID=483371 /ORGANISM="non described non described, Strain CCMP2298" /LENGTH=426 /DNA_ID=CAMNT_0014216049 /DNA_START=98 /DNA_END=1379 /DNA_ORIENTATION=-